MVKAPSRVRDNETLTAHDDTNGFSFDIGVVGLGYVGLPTALAFHAGGHRVLGLDSSFAQLNAIRTGDVDVHPVDRVRLNAALDDRVGFAVTTDPARLAEASAIVVCVPTPVDEHLMPDLSALAAACRSVVANARAGQLLMLTSTTYVGCTRDLLVEALAQRGLVAGRDINVAFAPERFDSGPRNEALPYEDVPRVVGGVTEACVARAAKVISGYANEVHRLTSLEAAEMTKLMENTFRAVNISLANEFADIGATLGLDIAEVIEAAATKPYGFMPFYPGPGVGGHCIPCDPHYLLWQLRAHRVNAPLIEVAMAQMAARPGRVVRRAVEILAHDGHRTGDARVLLVGVAYKPGVSDVRESPALEIIPALREVGAQVSYWDPMVPQLRINGTNLSSVADPTAADWDLAIVHTVHAGSDVDWLMSLPTLDTTYRFPKHPRLELL